MSDKEINKEIKSSKTIEETRRERKEKFKKEFRRVNLEYRGRLYIDEKYKKPGKVLRIDNDDAATRHYLSQLGYTVVHEDVKVGTGSLSETNNMGSAVHIEQGIMSSQPGILYEIDQDMYDARKELEAEDNNNLLQEMITANQYEGQVVKN